MNGKRILVIKTRAWGDTVLASAPLQILTEQLPQATIDLLLTEQWATVLQGTPGIREIFPYRKPRNFFARIWSFVAWSLRLRLRKYDCVINFHASPTTAWLARMSGAKTRSIHFHNHHEKNKFSTVTVPGKGTVKPAIERDMDAVRALGIPAPEGVPPSLFATEEEISEAQQRVSQIPRPILVLGLGASRPTKQWPARYQAQLTQKWVKETGGTVLPLVGPAEDHLLENLINSLFLLDSSVLENVTTFRRMNVRQVAALLAQTSIFVGNDSGPKHVAAAMGIPTITFFGPEHPLEWHPYPTTQHPYFFLEDLPCRKDAAPGMPPWCGLYVCIVKEDHRCMKKILPAQVYEKARQLLG